MRHIALGTSLSKIGYLHHKANHPNTIINTNNLFSFHKERFENNLFVINRQEISNPQKSQSKFFIT